MTPLRPQEPVNTPRSSGGYRKRHAKLNALFERLLACLLLGLSAPLFIILPPIIKLQDGGPVFYRGKRLGRGQRPFVMYKFRTLVPDAEQRLQGQLLNARHGLETPVGKFLRDTRLDELPQLINVLRGDMAFLGPRPERPAVYEAHCQHIGGYERRFLLKPGLIGYSQLLTPHATYKRLRAAIDNAYGRHDQRFLQDFRMVVLTLSYLALRAMHRGVTRAWFGLTQIQRTGRTLERRVLPRVSPKNVTVGLFADPDERLARIAEARLIDINGDCLRLDTDRPLPATSMHLCLAIRARQLLPRGKVKSKTARCTATVRSVLKGSSTDYGYSYILFYEPNSPFQRYLFDKYLVAQSIL